MSNLTIAALFAGLSVAIILCGAIYLHVVAGRAQPVALKYPAVQLAEHHEQALEINTRCYGEPLPGGQRYSRTTFKDNGDPILLRADGKRSVFCDLCDDMEPAA